MTHNEFILQYISTKVDYDGQYGYQCTDLAKVYSQQVWGIKPGAFGGSAKNANQSTFPGANIYLPGPGQDMKQGDILIQGATRDNIYGHVGIIHKVDRFGYFLLEQNATTGNGAGMGNDAVRINYYKWSSKPILRFFRNNKPN